MTSSISSQGGILVYSNVSPVMHVFKPAVLWTVALYGNQRHFPQINAIYFG